MASPELLEISETLNNFWGKKGLIDLLILCQLFFFAVLFAHSDKMRQVTDFVRRRTTLPRAAVGMTENFLMSPLRHRTHGIEADAQIRRLSEDSLIGFLEPL